MKVIILSILTRFCYCMQNDNLNNYKDGNDIFYFQVPDSVFETFTFEQESNLSPAEQDTGAASTENIQPEHTQVAPSQPVSYHDEYFLQNNLHMEPSQDSSLVDAGYPEVPWSTIDKPTEYVVPSNNSVLTSKALLFGGDERTCADSRNCQSFTSMGLLWGDQTQMLQPHSTPVATTADSGSGYSSSSWNLLFGDITQLNTATKTVDRVPAKAGLLLMPTSITPAANGCQALIFDQASSQERLPEQQTPGRSLPLKLFIKALNAVSIVMGKPKLYLTVSIEHIVSATLERFRDILEMLDNLDEFSVRATSANNIIDKSSVKTALERIRSHNVEFQGNGSDIHLLLSAINGRARKVMDQTECLKTLAVLLIQHAIIIYGNIPNVSFDEKGYLIVHGEYFPDVETMTEYRKEIYAKEKKRKLGASQDQPPAKVQKTKSRRPVDHSSSTRIKANLALMVDLYNQIAGHLSSYALLESQSFNSFAPHLIKSLDSLIDLAVKRGGSLSISQIHDEYPVDMRLLNRVQSYFARRTTPSKFYTAWFLLAFGAPGASSMNSAQKMYNLANWYAAVAMAVLGSNINVRYENGRVYVYDLPILPHNEGQTSTNKLPY